MPWHHKLWFTTTFQSSREKDLKDFASCELKILLLWFYHCTAALLICRLRAEIIDYFGCSKGFIAFLSKARASWYVWEHIMRPDHPHSGISDTSFYGFCHFVPKADLSILYEHDILVLMSYKNSLRLFLEGEYCHKFQFDRKSPSISPFYRPIWCKIGGNVAYFLCVPKRGNTYI